jgi:hypothetical protein
MAGRHATVISKEPQRSLVIRPAEPEVQNGFKGNATLVLGEGNRLATYPVDVSGLYLEKRQ